METGLVKKHRPRLEEVAGPDALTLEEVKFTLLMIQGLTAAQAFRKIFIKESRGMNNSQVSRAAYNLKNKPAIRDYWAALVRELEDAAVATALDLQIFLSAAVFTPISQIDENSPLCQKVKRSTVTTKDGGCIENEEIVAVNKLESARTLIRMKGLDAPIKVDVNHNIGVMVVPMASSVDEWAKYAAETQKALMADAIDI